MKKNDFKRWLKGVAYAVIFVVGFLMQSILPLITIIWSATTVLCLFWMLWTVSMPFYAILAVSSACFILVLLCAYVLANVFDGWKNLFW